MSLTKMGFRRNTNNEIAFKVNGQGQSATHYIASRFTILIFMPQCQYSISRLSVFHADRQPARQTDQQTDIRHTINYASFAQHNIIIITIITYCVACRCYCCKNDGDDDTTRRLVGLPVPWLQSEIRLPRHT